MKRRLQIFLSLVLIGLPGFVFSEREAATTSLETSAFLDAGPQEVATRLEDWKDDSRDRAVPVKFYFPAKGEGPFPVIVFSHGLGGSRKAYAYLGNHWASHGFVSVHLQHLGSDDATWRGVPPLQIFEKMKEAASVENFIARADDVTFAIGQLDTLNETESNPLFGKLDLGRIGMAGHSFGARTTMALAGEIFTVPGGETHEFSDDRIKAAVAMSPMPSPIAAHHETAYEKVTIPTMHLTGTLDTTPLEPGRTAAERLIPFEKTPGAHHYLINFQSGDHMIFSGRPRALSGLLGDSNGDEEFQALIRQSTTAFWKAWLSESPAAQAWLAAESNGLADSLGDRADYRHK